MTKEISPTTANKVRAKLDVIKVKLEKMEEAKNAGARTNGLFHWNGRTVELQDQNKAIKLSGVTSISLLISILGFLLTRKMEYELASEKLELDHFPVFQWSNYPLDAWENDIKSRINVITHQSEVEKLTKLRDELSKYVSEEDRVNQLLAQIEE
jgi:hypothetical protein